MKSLFRTLKFTPPLLASLLGAAALFAQEPAPEEEALTSGPAVGTKLTPVKSFATNGALAGQEFDAAAQLGKSPSALLFIHELTRNTAPVLRGLDSLTSEFSVLGFKSQTLMLSGDRTAAEAQLKRVNGSLRLANPIALSIDGAEGPGNYALNRKAALTLVFARDGVVTSTMALTDTGPNDVPVIRKAIVGMCGELPADPAELRKVITASLPDDPKVLKELVADQSQQLKQLRAQITRMQERMRGGGGAAMRREPRPVRPQPKPANAPDPSSPTTLNAANLTGQEIAELYHQFTGKRVLVSEAAARAEVSFIVPGQLTYAEAAKIMEKRLVMEGFMLQRSDGLPNTLHLEIADSSKARPVGGDRPGIRPTKPQRQGKAPDDPELNGLLRSFIRQTNDEARADEVFAKIKKRAAAGEELNEETIEMFKLMLSFPDRYGTKHAQGLAQSFLKENTAATTKKDK